MTEPSAGERSAQSYRMPPTVVHFTSRNSPAPRIIGAHPKPLAMPQLPTSVVLERLILDAPSGSVNLGWLLERLGPRSFGFVLLLLGICALLPVVSPIVGLLLTIPAFQMIRAHAAPVFPRRFAHRSVATTSLAAMTGRVIPALRYLERLVRPRWPTPFETTKRVIGGFVLTLGLLLLVPLPLSNIPVSITIMLMAFAYLEEDGILLALAMLIATVLFAMGVAALWSMIAGVVWLTKWGRGGSAIEIACVYAASQG
jgi:hypothetical protein